MNRSIAFLFLGLVFGAACGDDTPGQTADPGTTGGETATSSNEPDPPGSVEAGSPGDPDGPTCANVRCAAGTTCVMVQVQCIRAPCPPQPTCVPEGSTCAVTLCAPGTRCVESAGGARCEPIPTP